MILCMCDMRFGIDIQHGHISITTHIAQSLFVEEIKVHKIGTFS